MGEAKNGVNVVPHCVKGALPPGAIVINCDVTAVFRQSCLISDKLKKLPWVFT